MTLEHSHALLLHLAEELIDHGLFTVLRGLILQLAQESSFLLGEGLLEGVDLTDEVCLPSWLSITAVLILLFC